MSYKYKNSFLLGHIELTEKQSQFHKIMRNPDTRVVFISGPAGTAKTFLSVYTAIYKHNQDTLLKILYLRSLAESAEKGMGFLKGSMDDKFNPYIGPTSAMFRFTKLLYNIFLKFTHLWYFITRSIFAIPVFKNRI